MGPKAPGADLGGTAGNATIPVLVPTLQFGWGYIDATSVHEIVRRVASADYAVPAHSRAHASEMGMAHGAREAYWRT